MTEVEKQDAAEIDQIEDDQSGMQTLDVSHENNIVAAPALSDKIFDVPVKVSAVLGKVKLDVGTLLSLEDGSIIELNRKVGEPIDLYVNNNLIARGELVLNDGQLGVTMTEIVES